MKDNNHLFLLWLMYDQKGLHVYILMYTGECFYLRV